MPKSLHHNLFSPFKINQLTLRNRFVMPAMQCGFTVNGAPSSKYIEFLRDRAKGGVGLVISESTSIDHPSAYWQPLMARLDEDTMGAWKQVADALHSEGSAFLIQIWHPGSIRKVADDHPLAVYPALSPSGLVQEGRHNGRAMTRGELAEIKSAYIAAAKRAQQIGADGIEVHSAHGYLLDQFLWSETNIRSDEYGGQTLAERASYPAEIVAAIREAVGRHFIISYRFSQFKEVDYNARIVASPAELESMIALLRRSGVDVFHVSARRFFNSEWPESDSPDLTLAAWVKRMTDGAVITCGSVGLDVDVCANLFDDTDPAELPVEQHVQQLSIGIEKRYFDLISVGRSHIANSDFVKKIQEGRFREITLFRKKIHLKESIEAYEAGLVEESRKGDDPE